MLYAVMLFKELFASQLSVPSSPAHPTNCTTVLMKIYQANKEKQQTIIIENKKRKEQHEACISRIAPCIHSSHNDPFLFWNRLFFEFAKNVYLLIED